MTQTGTIPSGHPVQAPQRAPRTLLRHIVDRQVALSRWFDRFLPREILVDGNRDFLDRIVPRNLERGLIVWDIGGGKNPVVGRNTKTALELTTIGLDIDADQLASAGDGLYDRTVCADVCRYRGDGGADVVISQALLEHVRDTDGAMAAIASLLKPGGRALVFVPSGNAVYARLNRLLAQGLKRRILYAVFPHTRRDQGFPAYYDRCTPAALSRVACRHGLAVERLWIYFESSYFRCCFPLYLAWRLWMATFRRLRGAQAAETFSIVFRKEA